MSRRYCRRLLAGEASPQKVVEVLGQLMEEKCLLRRDAHALEEEVLEACGSCGPVETPTRRSVCMNEPGEAVVEAPPRQPP